MSANTLHRRHFLALSLAFCAALPSFAQSGKLFQTNGIAVNGADVTAYFTKGEAVAGSEEFSANWMDAKWLFASAEARDMFQADPKRFTPQYGGHCAYAAAKGSLAPSVPEAWTVYNDKLYLNFSLDVRNRWLQNPNKYIAEADANWPKL